MEKSNPVTEKLDAQFREAVARLDVLEAQGKQREAKGDMDEISGLRAARERAKQKLADMKQQASANLEATRREAESAVREFEAGIQRVNERYSAWDEARERRFNARLDEADAKVRQWKARADEKSADRTIKRNDELATLEERIALARATSAERRQASHSQKAAEALEDAARQFDKAYDAAAKRYE